MTYKKDKDGLSFREQEFCKAVSKGEVPSAAYARIWDAKLAKKKSIYVAASRLMKKANIQLRIKDIQHRMSEGYLNKSISQAVKDKELVLSKLRAIINEDIPTPENGVIRSLELLGKTVALFENVTISKTEESNSEDIARKISEILIEANQEKLKEESEDNQNIH